MKRALHLALASLALASLGTVAGCASVRGTSVESEAEAAGARESGAEVGRSETEAPARDTETEAAGLVLETEVIQAVPRAPPVPATSSVGGAASSVREVIGGADPAIAVQAPERAPWRGHQWALAPASPPRVMLASVDLPAGDAFRPPATSCQDVILFVREGELEATGTGIAPGDAPTTLYPGDAVRFGPEADGMVVNVGAVRARTVMAIARRIDTGEARVPPPDHDACAMSPPVHDPLVRPLRIASIATTPPLLAAAGRLEVRILLDEDGAGAREGAVSWLEGTPDLEVPEHMHPGSAEILFIEEGEGTMAIGDQQIAVRPGTAIYVPEGTLHGFRGAGTRPLRALQIYGPGGPEQRFRSP